MEQLQVVMRRRQLDITGESVLLTFSWDIFYFIIFYQDYILTMKTKKIKIFFMGQRSILAGER